MNKKNIIVIAVGVGVIVFLIIYWVLSAPSKDQAEDKSTTGQEASTTVDTTAATTTTSTAATSTTKTSGTTTKKKTTTAPVGAASESYVDALERYTASGYRIQFIGCSAKPGKLTVKKGKSFMLDNRGDKSIRVTVGTTNYYIGAYKYQIVTEYTLGTNYILCNGVRASEITVVQ